MREHIRASIARGYIHSDWVRKQIGQGMVVDDLGWPAESGDATLAYEGNSVGPARREIEVVMNGDDDPALFDRSWPALGRAHPVQPAHR